MRNLRGSIVLAWIFCIIVSVAAFINVAQAIIREPPYRHPFLLASDVGLALLPMLFALPAALIISRQPRNTIGWLLMILPLVSVLNVFIADYLSTYKTTPPPSTLPNLFITIFVNSAWVALIMPLLMIPLFFPTGRLLSQRWRWAIYLVAFTCIYLLFWGASSQTIQPFFAPWKFINPIGFIPDAAQQYFGGAILVMMITLTVTSLAAIVVRYRRAAAVEREQIKWLLYACAVFVLVYLPGLLIQFDQLDPAINGISNLIYSLVIIGFPAAITIAILRYHLFDIDVIIRQTLVYLILTGLVGLMYFGGVVLLQQAFGALIGTTSEAAVVITTLAIAALFNTLRRRIQHIINRRFFRQKYNAEKTLNEFSMAARNNTDLDALTSMLIHITQETLQPTHVDLLLRERNEILPVKLLSR